jgi:hypothetical protein
MQVSFVIIEGLNKTWNGILSIPIKILKHGMENRKRWNGKYKT